MASATPKRTSLHLLQTVVLIGLMGSGKTSIGRRLAARLHVPFHDSDHEVEAAAAMSVADIFAVHGESAFRDTERKVIARLLGEGISVIATGGGAFIDERTREAVRNSGKAVWLRASIPVLLERTSRTHHRPLLAGKDGAAVLSDLAARRNQFYQLADATIDTDGYTAEGLTDRLIEICIERGWIKDHGSARQE